MAVQTTEEFKNGGATSYTITIEYLQISDIKVRIGGALQTYTTGTPGSGEYSVSGTTVTLGAAAPAGTGNVHIYRETDVNTAAAVFAAGSSIRAADLNAVHDMARMGIAEARSQVITADVKEDAITSDKIADDQINSEHYVAGSIDLEHMSANSVDSDQYVDGSIDLIHMSANSVDSDQYVDGSIDLVHMSPNSVDSDQYVDGSIDLVHMSPNSVDSDQYVDGSIDLVHMSPNSVDSDQYVDGSIDTVHIANDQVTYEKIQDVSATDRVLGRDSSGAGVVEEIAPSALRTMINVEDGATADQTNAEIKTAYEANSDTNAFTDAEKTKLGNLGSLNALSDVNTAGVADDKILKYDASVSKFIIADESSGSGGSSTFTGLSDTPANFGSAAGKTLKVNSGETAVEFVDVSTDIVNDSTPQLGGNLDVQASEITTSTTNGNIKLAPNGTGKVEIKGNGSNDAQIVLNCSDNSHGQVIKAPPHSAGVSNTFTLPTTNVTNLGAGTHFLKTNSAGQIFINSAVHYENGNHINMASGKNIYFGSNNGIIFDSDNNTTHEIYIKGPTTLTKDSNFTLPEDGSSGQFLTTDGSGALSFADPNKILQGNSSVEITGTGNNAGVFEVKLQDNGSNTNAAQTSLKQSHTGTTNQTILNEANKDKNSLLELNHDWGTNAFSEIQFRQTGSTAGTNKIRSDGHSELSFFADGTGTKKLNINATLSSFGTDVYPLSDNAKKLGSTNYKWSEVHATTFHGSGANLTDIESTVANGCIYENNTQITTDFTTSTTKNSMSAGPITIANNVTLTIPNNSVYTIV